MDERTSQDRRERKDLQGRQGARGGAIAKRMSLVAIAAALIALLVVGLASGASGPKKHHFVLKEHSAYLKTTHGFPNPGGRSLEAGVSKMKVGGDVKRGASKHRNETLSVANGVAKFKGTSSVYDRSGSTKTRYHGTATLRQDGSIAARVKGRIVGGSKAYRGATGRFTGTATLSEPPRVGAIEVSRVEGTITY